MSVTTRPAAGSRDAGAGHRPGPSRHGGDRSAQRPRLGRIGGRTAQRANDIWGCGAPLGGRIEQVPGRADVVTARPGKANGTGGHARGDVGAIEAVAPHKELTAAVSAMVGPAQPLD
ncbi:hypothetical protein [Kitasatospora griseola]|uniref:hypothetical protein n=1 Tax=Kitasatospora griseola TaxID=2064 RepID=UPI00380F503D